MSDRARYTLTIEATPDAGPCPDGRRLAQVLKGLLRVHGFRCLDVRPVEPETAQQATTADAAAGTGDR